MNCNNGKIKLSMNAMLYGNDFFEQLTDLKEGEYIELATVTFSSFDGGESIKTHLHVKPINEILITQFDEEILLLNHKLLELFDLEYYKNDLIDRNEYKMTQLYIKAEGEELIVSISFEDFILNTILDDDFDDKGVMNEFVGLLEKIEVKCTKMLDSYVTINDEKDEN